MSVRTPALAALLVAATLAVAACGGGSTATNRATALSDATAPAASVPQNPGPSDPAPTTGANGTPMAVPDTCSLVSPADIQGATGLAVNAGQDVTADTGWSSACTWVVKAAPGEATYSVLVKVLAPGTLATFKSKVGAHPIAGLADEAYVFDDGRQIAMRFGQLVAIVAGARGVDGNGVPAAAVEALARRVAERMQR